MATTPASDPLEPSASELVALYRGTRLSPVEVVAAALARIEGLQPLINASCHVDAEAALASARAAEARWASGFAQGPGRWRAAWGQG